MDIARHHFGEVVHFIAQRFNDLFIVNGCYFTMLLEFVYLRRNQALLVSNGREIFDQRLKEIFIFS